MKNIKTKTKLMFFPLLYLIIIIISGLTYNYYGNIKEQKNVAIMETTSIIENLLKGRISVIMV